MSTRDIGGAGDRLMPFDPGPIPKHRPSGPLDALMASFGAGTTLVDRSVEALSSVIALLGSIDVGRRDMLDKTLDDLRAAIDSGVSDRDNLLVAPADGRWSMVVFALARKPSGALAVQPIEIDRRETAIDHHLSRLRDALERRGHAPGDDLSAHLQRAKRQAATASTLLGIVKTRLDLQATFVETIRDADPGAAVVRLDEHFDGSKARAMALATRSLLGRQSLNIANGNASLVEALFAGHAVSHAR